MSTNPILDEIHATRERLLADDNGDLHAYVEAARKRALESGRTLIPPKRFLPENAEVAGPPKTGEIAKTDFQ